MLRYVVRKSEEAVGGAEINHVDQFFDVLGRVKYEQSYGFGKALNTPELVETASGFDNRGNVIQKSNPYYASDSAIFTTMTYDDLGRLVQTQRPTSDSNGTLLTESVTYSGLAVIRTDALSHTQSTVNSAWGTVLQATDQAGKTTAYTYNAFGDLRSTTDPATNVSQIYYNTRGFKIGSADPDMGSWNYTYDELGRLLTQADAMSQTTIFTYDALNRTETFVNVGKYKTDFEIVKWTVEFLNSIPQRNNYLENTFSLRIDKAGHLTFTENVLQGVWDQATGEVSSKIRRFTDTFAIAHDHGKAQTIEGIGPGDTQATRSVGLVSFIQTRGLDVIMVEPTRQNKSGTYKVREVLVWRAD